jgi:Rnl2 family RNA ligase
LLSVQRAPALVIMTLQIRLSAELATEPAEQDRNQIEILEDNTMKENEVLKNHPLHDKFPSVVNLNNPNQLEIFVNEFPELLDCMWVIEEKYHGFNFQMTWLPRQDDPIAHYEPEYAGSREMQVTRDTSFYGAWAAIDRHAEEFAKVQRTADQLGSKITLYAEFFGGKVSKGVSYNIEPGKYKIRIIGLKVNNDMYAPSDRYAFLGMVGLPVSMYATPIAIVQGINAAAAYSAIFHAMDAEPGDGSDDDRSFAEGFVAKPYTKHFVNKGGKTIMIKKKNPRFEEIVKEKTVREVNPVVEEMREVFRGYLNDNRINSALSKLGPITSKSQIGKYSKFIVEDAKADFMIDHAEAFTKVSPDTQRFVFNVGSELANTLIEMIEESAA